MKQRHGSNATLVLRSLKNEKVLKRLVTVTVTADQVLIHHQIKDLEIGD